MPQAPAIWLGGSLSDLYPSSPLKDSYDQLISTADVFGQTGARVFRMWSGVIDLASPRQVSAGLLTEAQRQENARVLRDIAAYCREHGIVVSVEDNFTWATPWFASWTGAATEAGLPVAYVDGGENLLSIPATPAAMTALAKTMAGNAATIAKAFPGVQIGDVQPPVAPNQAVRSQALRDWWATYNQVADSMGAPRFSYFLADMAWNSPDKGWVAVLQQTFKDAVAADLAPGIFVNGFVDSIAADRWVAQAQQHLADMLTAGPIAPGFVVLETWSADLPDSVTPINGAGSMAFLAASIERLSPYYQDKAISAHGAITVRARAQLLLRSDEPGGLRGVSIGMTEADLAARATAGVLLIGQTAVLTAQAIGAGQVSGNSSNSLLLVGTAGELTAMLASVRVAETVAGPDRLQISVFNAEGQAALHEINLLAVPVTSPQAGLRMAFNNEGGPQTWASASVVMGNNGLMASQTLTWFAGNHDDARGAYVPQTTILLHSPLLTSRLTLQNGRWINAWAQKREQFDPGNQNLATDYTTQVLLDTVLTFSPASGAVRSETSRIAPDGRTDPTLNPLAAGGLSVKQYNDGYNPNWLPSWDSRLGSVTTITGRGGVMIEQVLDWKPGAPWEQSILTMSPTTGKLWQRIDTLPSGSSFVTGQRVVTQYNTGDNPNWDYAAHATDRSVATTFSNGRATEQTVFTADGLKRVAHWCYDGSEAWTSNTVWYDANGLMLSTTFHWQQVNTMRAMKLDYTPGSTVAHQRWDFYRAGGYIRTEYDVSNTAAYTTVEYTYDVNNKLVRQQQNHDPGGPVSHSITHFDPTNAALRQVETYTASSITVTVSRPDGSPLLQGTVPLAQAADLVSHARMRFLTTDGGNETLRATADNDYFVIGNTAPRAGLVDIIGFARGADIIALPRNLFGDWSRIQAAATDSAGGTLLRSLDGRQSVLLHDVLPPSLTHQDVAIL
ncbi:MAG: hypothetical protein AB7F35_28140 [Acetobacteraceae bacterium]